MAETKQRFNAIKIARGKRAAFPTEYKAPGLPFYDVESQGLYIADTNSDTSAEAAGEFIRVGGISSFVFKGKLPNDLAETNEVRDLFTNTLVAEVGDAYIVPNDITASIPGDLNLYKNDLIIYVGTIADLPDDSILFDKSWLRVSNGELYARNVKFDPTNEDWVFAPSDTNVQSAMDTLAKKKLQFLGEVKQFARPTDGTSLQDATTDMEVSGADGTQKVVTLHAGEFVYYVGEDTKVGLLEISKFSFVINENGSYHVLSIGAKNAEDLKFKWAAYLDRSTDASIAWGEGYDKTDADVTTITDALDDLMRTKADLQKNGKIPVSQIPATLVGALQYKTTVSIDEIEAHNDTEQALADYLAQTYNKVTNSDSMIDDNADGLFDPLDAGDYFIIDAPDSLAEVTVGSKTYNKGDWLIYNGAGGFDKLNASSSVDSVNNLIGSVNIIKSTRKVGDDAGVTTPVDESVITIDNTKNAVIVEVPNAVLENNEVKENQLLKAGPDRTAEDAGLTVVAPSAEKGTVLKDTQGIEVEFPSESGRVPTLQIKESVTVDKTQVVNSSAVSLDAPEFSTFDTTLPEGGTITTEYVIWSDVLDNSAVAISSPVVSVVKRIKSVAAETEEVTICNSNPLFVAAPADGIIKFNESLSFDYDDEGKKYFAIVEAIPEPIYTITYVESTKAGKVEVTLAKPKTQIKSVSEAVSAENKLPKFDANDNLTESVIAEDSDAKIVSINNDLRYDYGRHEFAEDIPSSTEAAKTLYHKLPRVGQGTDTNPNVLLNDESTIDGGLWM